MNQKNAKEKPKCIILIGPPACGKGTQAKLLEKNISNSITISTGELLRKSGDLSGNYVDDEIIKSLIQQEIYQYSPNTTFILDGAVRTLPQIEIAKELFTISSIISFDSISFEELKKRIISRGRVEDPHIRIQDYIEKSSCVREYFSMYYSDNFHSINASMNKENVEEEIRRKLEI
ncbi:MAG: nucleoside monophosphate kinase [Nanoarchaeota archaeon]|nr:nucleoside monophosphate kinase [Nanoarchaeota archaeon]